MDRAEYESLVRVQSVYLEKIGPETRFTARTICDMHRDWLGDIYDWAGKYRDVELQGEKARQQEYLSAVRAGYVEEFDPLTVFFLEAIERRLRGARR